MIRRLAWLPLLCLPLFTACSEKESPTAPHDDTLNVPEEHSSIQAAAAAAIPGDKIVVSYREEAYTGDVALPAGVTLMGHTLNPLIPVIEGQVSMIGGDASASIEGLKITNDSGPGIVLQDSDASLIGLWIQGCSGPGVSLRGDSHARISGCDIQNCSIGVQIMGVTQSGDSTTDDNIPPAARIGYTNFIDNGPAGDFSNIVFGNIPVPYTVLVSWNYWGEGVATPHDTITDGNDNPTIEGIAETTGSWFPTPITHWWQR